MGGFLDNKVAVVTGATRGIGLAVATALHREGASVVVCGRNEGQVKQVVDDLGGSPRAGGIATDVRDPESVARLFQYVDREFAGIDVLVNNAGIGIFSPVADLTFEQWKVTLDTNLHGVYYCCHEAIPRLRHRGGGAIINISSLAGKNAFAEGAAYNASKAGLNAFSEAMMLDHRHDGIRVCYVMPGSVDTDFRPGAARASWKIAPEDIAEIVTTVLRMPERTTISRVEVRPSRPPK